MLFHGDNMTSLHRNNRSAVLWALQHTDGTSRKRLAETLSLTPAAITHITSELLSEHLLREGELMDSTGAGRREKKLEINPKSGCALGILLNVKKAVLSATYLDGSTVFTEEVVLDPQMSADDLVLWLSSALQTEAFSHGIMPEDVVGLGLAVRGIPTQDGRGIANSFGVFKERNYPICDRFAKQIKVPTILDNNVRALSLAERFLSRGQEEAEFFLRCEYGIGASLTINGQIWHGISEQGGEIGHIPVVPRGGKLCSCGKCGCLETIASPTAIREDALAVCQPDTTPVLWKMVQSKGENAITVEDVFQAARSGDTGTADVIGRAIKALAQALKAVIYLVDPGKITLYGRMFDDSFVMSRLLSEMSEGVDEDHRVRVVKSAFNRRLENRCACLLAVKHFFDEGGLRR